MEIKVINNSCHQYMIDISEYSYLIETEQGIVEFFQGGNRDIYWNIIPHTNCNNFSFTISLEENPMFYLATYRMFEEIEQMKIEHLKQYIQKKTIWHNNEEITYRMSKKEKRRRKNLFKNNDPYYQLMQKNTFIWKSDAPANENQFGYEEFVYNYWIINKTDNSYIFTFKKSQKDNINYCVDINTDRSRYESYRFITWKFYQNLKNYLSPDYQITIEDYVKVLSKKQ